MQLQARVEKRSDQETGVKKKKRTNSFCVLTCMCARRPAAIHGPHFKECMGSRDVHMCIQRDL